MVVAHKKNVAVLRWMAAGVLCCAAVVVGCKSSQPIEAPAANRGASLEVGRGGIPSLLPPIDNINLFSMPMALNFDDKPGADGFQVRVSLIQKDQPLFVELLEGRVEFLMYDGRVAAGLIADTTPLRVWGFDAGDLKAYANRSLVGWNYLLALKWGDTPPRKSSITVTVRLLKPDGRHLYALPVDLTVHHQ